MPTTLPRTLTVPGRPCVSRRAHITGAGVRRAGHDPGGCGHAPRGGSPVTPPAPPRALAGLKVVEFAVYAAGPMVGKHLGEHGATVIRVESRSRPDGFRVHYPPYKDNVPGLNRTGSFALFNDSKLGITLNLKAP